jgi:hypothetical protein
MSSDLSQLPVQWKGCGLADKMIYCDVEKDETSGEEE